MAFFPQFDWRSSLSLNSPSPSLLFIDAGVDDSQLLLNGVAAGTEVYRLDRGQDAITQITQTLSGRRDIASLQIVSHGRSGGLQLGESWLDLQTLPSYVNQLKSWSAALSADADMLLYGCDVAAGEAGRSFVDLLAQVTGADVAASDDLTGSAALGGDWDLEVQTGSIESALQMSAEFQSRHQFILAPGDLDTSFGIGGETFFTPILPSVVIDNNDRIVVASSPLEGGFALTRYTNTGALDGTFGTGGQLISSFGSSLFGRNEDRYSSLAIDASDRIVVAGTNRRRTFNNSEDEYSDFALARYTNTGTLDETFGAGGTVIASTGFRHNSITSLAIDESGRIVVAGISSQNKSEGDSDFVLARYTNGGILDNTFGVGGSVSVPMGIGNYVWGDVTIDASGQIMAGTWVNNGDNYVPVLLRYTSNGMLDMAFGMGGMVNAPIITDNEYYGGFALDSNGRIVILGGVDNNNNYDFTIVRYTSMGDLDETFGIGGKVDSSSSNVNGRYSDLVIDDNDRIILLDSRSTSEGSLVRYTSTGVLDSRFRAEPLISPIITIDGITTSNGSHVPTDLVIDTSGRIIVVGFFSTFGGGFATRFQGSDGELTFKLDSFARNATTQAVVNFYLDPVTQLQTSRNLTYSSSFGTLVGQTVTLGSEWTIAAVADFNRDGIDDVLLHTQSGDEVKLWTIGPNAQVTAIQAITGSDGNILKTGNLNWKVMGFVDVDRDNILDIVWHNPISDEVGFWLMNSNGVSVRSYDYLRDATGAILKTGNPLWQVKGVADFDGDGDVDLLFRLPELNQTAIVRLNGPIVTDAQYITTNADATLQIRGVADRDGDRIPDIYWQSPDQRKVLVQTIKFQGGKWLTDDFALADPTLPLPIAA
jgi:uncharacterized delta-60 repeat protein